MPFCTELIARAEAGEDPLEIAQDARGRVFEQWDSIDTAPAAQRLAWAQDAAFAAGLNSVDLELRDADIAAAARKGKNKGGFIPKWAGQKKGCKAKLPEKCKCGQRKGRNTQKIYSIPQVVSREEGWAILRNGVKLKDKEGKTVEFGKITRKHLKHTPDIIKERTDKALSQIPKWKDTYQPEIRSKLNQQKAKALDHLQRPDFMLFAIDTTRTGKVTRGYKGENGRIRWIYKKDYTLGKRNFTMNVVTEEYNKKRRVVVTFFDGAKK